MPLICIKKRSQHPRPPLLFHFPKKTSLFLSESDADLSSDHSLSALEDSPTLTTLSHVQKWKDSRLASGNTAKPSNDLISDLVKKITSGTTASSSSSHTAVQLARKETNSGLKKANRSNTKSKGKTKVSCLNLISLHLILTLNQY